MVEANEACSADCYKTRYPALSKPFLSWTQRRAVRLLQGDGSEVRKQKLARRPWTENIKAVDQEVSEAGDPKESGRIETKTLIDAKGMKKREGAMAFGLNRINRSIQGDEPRCGTLGNKLK